MKKTIHYILLLGLLIRLVTINQSFWLDEATSGLVVRNLNFREIITNFAVKDFHPPLYYLVLKAWSLLFGTTEISLRMVSVLFSLGTIYVVYLIGKRLKNSLVGTLAALFLAIAPLFVYYSQEARMYSMVTFFVTLSCYYFLGLSVKKTKRELFLFALTLPCILLTDYLAILIVPVFWIYAYSQKKKLLKPLLYAHIPLFLAFLVILPLFKTQLTSGVGIKSELSGWWNILGKTSIKNTLLIPVKFIIGRISFYNKLLYGGVVLSVVSIYGFLLLPVIKNKKYRLILFWLIIPILMGLLIGFFVPVVSYFRFLFVLPALYILLALSLSNINEDKFLPVFLLLVLLNFVFVWRYFSIPRFQREDWRGLTRFIQEESKDKNIKVIFVANSQMEAYRYYLPDAPVSGPDGIQDGLDVIWLMRYVQPVFDPGDTVRQDVERRGYTKQSEHTFNGIVVWRYDRQETKK